jgi:hypothetical protein
MRPSAFCASPREQIPDSESDIHALSEPSTKLGVSMQGCRVCCGSGRCDELFDGDSWANMLDGINRDGVELD